MDRPIRLGEEEVERGELLCRMLRSREAGVYGIKTIHFFYADIISTLLPESFNGRERKWVQRIQEIGPKVISPGLESLH
jgi:hypothetical protein